ncbi:mur ligase middle domain protein [Clostridium baratii str. Sullivan]|uniref:Mur ligase middle domain protein n=1 Tax=Clostridium baratii str. Sullivan TaxID=1415775 RepID=A0A0A7FSA9_9CLOT|nr:Mur ligase family protein [Clostridium baratii]AIY82502.1 mur ligase middle domain protein [Clostridium baratii str. Sullivan]
MNIERIRFLAEKNITGMGKVIFIKGTDLKEIAKKYEDVCSKLSINGRILKLGNESVYLSYDRESIASMIIEAILDDDKDILNNIAEVLKNDWKNEIIKKLRENNISEVELQDDSLLIGYGENSIILTNENYKDFNIDEIINKLVDKWDIPIIAVTGTNGKTSTTRLIYNTLLELGYRSGMSSTGGIIIGNETIRTGDTTGYYSALEVLKRKDVNVAVLETARGGLIKKGLGFKNARACIITSLSEDHMGMEGVNSLEQLGKVKALIKEGLKEDGVMVVRATNEIVNLFNANDKLILFENDKNDIICNHIKNGGEAFYTKQGYIVHNLNGVESNIVSLNELEFTHNGASESNVRNVMAAIASIKTIDNDINKISNALKNIKCDLTKNKGRQNILNIKDFKLIIDYGHNSEAFNEVFNIAKSLNPTRITGLITAPGDRTDNHIIELGEIAAKFCDKVIIKEQEDKRGKENGETAKLLKRGLINKGFKEENIIILLEERDAILKALNDAIAGEIIVSFSQFLHLTIPAINEFLSENKLELINI